MFCQKCKAEAVKVVDHTIGAARGYYECACDDGVPLFPLVATREEIRPVLHRKNRKAAA